MTIDDYWMQLWNGMWAEIVVTFVVTLGVQLWRSMRKEEEGRPLGTINRQEALYWSATVLPLIGCVLIGLAVTGHPNQTALRLLGGWSLYLIVSSVVLWFAFENLMARKRDFRMVSRNLINRGRGELTDGTLAKIGSLFLWSGFLLYLGPRPFTVPWSFVMALAIDGYIFWRVLKLD
jgi:hypothetical protein